MKRPRSVAAYTIIIEFFVYRDLSLKEDLPRIVMASMSMAGAIIIIWPWPTRWMNYVVDQRIPNDLLNLMLEAGIERRWEFLLVMNVFPADLGYGHGRIQRNLRCGFRSSFPLWLIWVCGSRTKRCPLFQLGMIFILNLELAYCMPPSPESLHRKLTFQPTVASLCVVLPFAGVLLFCAARRLVCAVDQQCGDKSDIEAIRTRAEHDGLPPRDAWMLECVQADPNDPRP